MLVLVFGGCKSNNALSVYEYNPKTNENPITPNNLSLFFEKSREDIVFFNIDDKNAIGEFDRIQNHLKEKVNKNEAINKLGIFYFAFVRKKDTIYADYELQYWRNKNKSSFYKSAFLKKIVKNSEH